MAMALLGCLVLLIIGIAVLTALFFTPDIEEADSPQAFAFLPVPEDSPHVRAFLEFYASQILWMDASVLQCVILISTPQTQELCTDLARDYACYATMTLDEAHHFISDRCGTGENSGNS
jgi:hypothetical protein